MYKHNKSIVPLAKNLRKNMTKEEKHLWYDFLRTHPARFIRQKALGPYIVDFYCAVAKLVIELDGSQHFSDEHFEYDVKRTEFLGKEYGIRVVRFTNIEITKKFSGVCAYIDELISQSLSQQS